MTKLPFNGREHLVPINGWNRAVGSELPKKSNKSVGLLDWLRDLLDS